MTPVESAARKEPCYSLIVERRSKKVKDHKLSYPRACNKNGEYAVEVINHASIKDIAFGVQVTIKNIKTGEKHFLISHSGNKPLHLGVGTYEIITESDRHGFPQEARYEIVDAVTGRVIEAFERSHVAVTNILIEERQVLRIIVLPSTRPYNAIFYRFGPRRTPVAHFFARPYPSSDFGIQEFNGKEQFSAVPIAVAFWGTKLVKEHPEIAQAIKSEGVPTLREGQRERDPILVLGARHIAEDLADVFLRQKSSNAQEYRGQFHTTFLVKRDSNGKVPEVLMSSSRQSLIQEFERRIIWMFRHNVHRPHEGGGYAGRTFMEDLAEGKEKMLLWPMVSRESSDAYLRDIIELEELIDRQGIDADYVFSDGSKELARHVLSRLLHWFLLSLKRERQNYITYEPEWLEPVVSAKHQSITERLKEIDQLFDRHFLRLKEIAPALANEF